MIRFVIAILAMSLMSHARPIYFNQLSGKFAPDSIVQQYKCISCHMGNGSLALNLFGQDFRSVFVGPNPLKIPGIGVMTNVQKWDMLLNKMDSNKNSVSNYDDFIHGVHAGFPEGQAQPIK